MKEIKTKKGLTIFVDDNMYDRCMQFTWIAHKNPNTWYATTQVKCPDGKYSQFSIHQLILNFPSLRIDHKDGNGLNNTIDNIRPATVSQNAMNNKKRINTSSKFKGVSWDKRKKKWAVCLRVNKIQFRFGYYDCEVAAALQYDTHAVNIYKEFARLNFT